MIIQYFVVNRNCTRLLAYKHWQTIDRCNLVGSIFSIPINCVAVIFSNSITHIAIKYKREFYPIIKDNSNVQMLQLPHWIINILHIWIYFPFDMPTGKRHFFRLGCCCCDSCKGRQFVIRIGYLTLFQCTLWSEPPIYLVTMYVNRWRNPFYYAFEIIRWCIANEFRFAAWCKTTIKKYSMEWLSILVNFLIVDQMSRILFIVWCTKIARDGLHRSWSAVLFLSLSSLEATSHICK